MKNKSTILLYVSLVGIPVSFVAGVIVSFLLLD